MPGPGRRLKQIMDLQLITQDHEEYGTMLAGVTGLRDALAAPTTGIYVAKVDGDLVMFIQIEGHIEIFPIAKLLARGYITTEWAQEAVDLLTAQLDNTKEKDA